MFLNYLDKKKRLFLRGVWGTTSIFHNAKTAMKKMIRRRAVQETGISWRHGDPNEDISETPKTLQQYYIAAMFEGFQECSHSLWYRDVLGRTTIGFPYKVFRLPQNINDE